MNVVGVSFHVGSRYWDATKDQMVLKYCKRLFEMAKRDYGINDGVYGAFNNLVFDRATVRPISPKYHIIRAKKRRTFIQSEWWRMKKRPLIRLGCSTP